MSMCNVDLDLAMPAWDDTGLDWDDYGCDWTGALYFNICRPACWDDCQVFWDDPLHTWEGWEIDVINVLQMQNDTQGWTTIQGTFEASLITQHWIGIFPPDAISCWGVQWTATGDDVYYRWIKANACGGCVTGEPTTAASNG